MSGTKKLRVAVISPNPAGTSGVGNYVRNAMIGTQESIDWISLAQGVQTKGNRAVFLPNTNIKMYPSAEYPDAARIMDVFAYEKPDILMMTDDFWKHNHFRNSLKHFREKFKVKCVWWGIMDANPPPLELSQELDKWDAVFGLTRLTTRIYEEMLGKDSKKIYYVPHPIETDRFVKRTRNHDLYKALFGNRDYKMLFVMIGNNQLRKNFATTIYAFCEWARTLPKKERDRVGMLIKTDHYVSPHGTNLARVAQRYGGFFLRNPKRDLVNIHLIDKHPAGRVLSTDDIIDIHNLADFFVQTSKQEGFGLPVSESLCCEVPVIANMCGGITEQADPRFAITLTGNESLIAYMDSISIFESVLGWQQIMRAFDEAYKTTSSKRAEMGRLGREHAVRNYKSSNVCNKLVNSIRSVLGLDNDLDLKAPAKKKAVAKKVVKKSKKK